jgi:uncharacterized linocin/CFP29 family protein
MNHLHRGAAPISDTAWARIDEEARTALHQFLAARRLVDVDGPLGWDQAALAAGDLEPIEVDSPSASDLEAQVALRSVVRLVEVRVPFNVDRQIIRKIDRGAPSLDLDPLIDAARRAAAIEDDAVFAGLKAAGVDGCAAGSDHEPVAFSGSQDLADAVAEGTAVLGDAGVEGPYGLAVGDDLWRSVVSTVERGYPLVKHLRLIAGGPVVRATTVSGAVLLSQRGGDFELVIGGDFAVGYEATAAGTVVLYLAETFTFRNLEPAAAVALRQR